MKWVRSCRRSNRRYAQPSLHRPINVHRDTVCLLPLQLSALLGLAGVQAIDQLRDMTAPELRRRLEAVLTDLAAAVAAADPTDRIVIFGSFYTVGGVLHDGVPRLSAQHLAG